MSQAQLPELTVRLRHAYHLHTLVRMLRDLRPILDLREPTIVTVNLRDLTFIGPACLAFMVAVLRRGRENQLVADDSMILHPTSVAARTYLHRMDVLQVLFEREPNEVADPVTRHDASGLKECEHFESQQRGRDVTASLVKALQEEVETDDVSLTSLDLCLQELTENVYFHADTTHGGFAAAQSFRNTREIEVAIVDLGIGIAESLRQNPEHALEASDDLSAIRAAIRPLVTATPERNSGYGLAFTRFLMEMNSGRLIVWSGEGWVQCGEKYAEKTKDRMPGTVVALRLHTDRPFDFNRAYDKLTAAIEQQEGPLNDDVRLLKNASR
jgi:anti-sigma regulatory factor (Ser/Thr protein kinase)